MTARVRVAINEQALLEQIAIRLDAFDERLLKTAQSKAPLGKRRTPKSGYNDRSKGSKGKNRVEVLIDATGYDPKTGKGLRVAEGARATAAVRRAVAANTNNHIYAGSVPDISGEPGLRRYTFKRSNPPHLRETGEVIPARIEGNRVVGGIRFTAPHAWYVEKGHHTSSGSYVEGKGFMVKSLDEHLEELPRLMED